MTPNNSDSVGRIPNLPRNCKKVYSLDIDLRRLAMKIIHYLWWSYSESRAKKIKKK